MAKQRGVEGQISIRKSSAALAMIHKERLEAIIGAAEEAARELANAGVPIDQVEVERMIDPEIENRIRLGFTVWLPGTAMGQASAAWDRLLELARSRVNELGAEETRKLSELVSLGVDVE
jgi:hypothetical protein